MRPWWLVAQYELPIKNHSGIFRIDLHANLVTPNEDENPRFDMPWQVATLNEERAQYIVPLQFYILW
jgi:hypothetical protein